jgi:Spy/CpxP family protein refolding chaperone
MLSLLLLTVMLAQAPSAERPASRGNRASLTNGELVDMLDTYAIVQAQKALQLADTQYAQFVARLKSLQQVRRRASQARNQLIQELRRLTQDPTPDENTLRARVRALHEHDATAAEELRRAYDALDEVLDPRQQARFRIFEDRIERQKLDLLLRVRHRANLKTPAPRKPDGSR